MEKFKLEAISFAQTFVALFLADIAFTLAEIPVSEILSGEVLTGAFVVGIISASIRSALKASWQKFMPVKLGGKK